MARKVLTNVIVKVNNVDLSDHIASVELSRSFDDIETTAYGNAGRTRVGGLEDSSISLDFHQDWAAGEVEATIQPLLGGTASFEIIPDGTAVSATNPKYSGTVLITEWTPVSGGVGELATASVTWPVSGVVTYGTA
jgi:hypothetical protein